jgi:hypothetical protein
MKKVLVIVTAAVFLAASSLTPASAHVSAQSKGYTLEAGKSSRLWFSLGHGCEYKNSKFGTSVFQVVVPSAAGKPTPEFHYGFKAAVVASKEVDAKNVPLNYTVTWTAKSRSHVIDDGTFYDFGVKLAWNSTPQVIAFPVTQICYSVDASGRKPLYLKWIITDGTKKDATEDTEYGPAPTVTTVATAAK